MVLLRVIPQGFLRDCGRPSPGFPPRPGIVPAAARAGQGGANNAYWECRPNVVLPAGTYTVVDSDPATWAQNAQSAGRGIVEVKGAYK